MSVSDGQEVNAAVSNAAWVSKTQNSTMVGELDLNNATSGGQISNAQQQINDNTGEIATNKGNITTNTSNISSNATDIGANNTNIATNTGDIAALDVRVTALEGISPLSFQGGWDADTNTPTLTSSTGTEGHFYVVTVAGTTNLDGISDWAIGDWAVFDGSVWIKVDNTDLVTSVNGQTGAVVLDADDIAETATRYWSLKNNLDAIVDPTVNDDIDLDYVEGSQWFNQTNSTLFICTDNSDGAAVWAGLSGSGGVGSDTISIFVSADNTDVGDLDTGNNATPLGGGTLDGSVTTETSGLLSGTQDFKYTQSTTSLNDYVAIPSQTVNRRHTGKSNNARLVYSHDGNDGDFELVAYDNTNTLELKRVALDAGENIIFNTDVFLSEISGSTLDIRLLMQVAVSNNGAIFQWNDMLLDSDPFIQTELQGKNRFTARIQNNSTASIISQEDSFIASVNRSALGTVDITFTSNFFSVVPGILVTATSTGDINAAATVPATTGCTVLTRNTANTAIDSDFTITVAFQGDDIKDPDNGFVVPAKSTLSDVQAFSSPTFNGGWGTVANDELYIERVGRYLHITGTADTGTVSAAVASLTLPTVDGVQLNIDTDRINSTTREQSFGRVMRLDAALDATNNMYTGVYDGTNTDRVQFAQALDANAYTNENYSSIASSSEKQDFDLRIPIAEWTPFGQFLALLPVPKTLKVSGGNAFGSTNTRIRRFSTVDLDEVGDFLTYADSATDGASLTCVRECIADISYSDRVNGGNNRFMGLSLNSTQLTTDLPSITDADFITGTMINGADVSNALGNVSAHLKLAVGDVIRPHCSTGTQFNASKVVFMVKVEGV